MSDYDDYTQYDVSVHNAVNYAKLVVDLNAEVARLNNIIKNLRVELEIKDKSPVPITVISQVAEQKEEIDKLKEDLEYYKKLLPKHIIINRENRQVPPTRKGGLR